MSKLAIIICLLTASFAANAVSVVDDTGYTVTLNQPAQRIISLAPSMTELLFAAGAGDKLVGVSEYSDYPIEAASLPIIGRYDLLNTEAILALQPDLIVAWKSGNPKAAVERLRALGLTVYIAEPTTVLSIAAHVEKFAQLAGSEAIGGPRARDFRARLELLKNSYSDKAPISVFYQVWNAPLISVGGNELINDIIQLCGGKNIFADLALAPKVSVEAVIQRNPQVIIASGMDVSRPEWLDDWLVWPQVAAVQQHNLYFIPPDLVQRHSLRVIQGATQMCNYIDLARQQPEQHVVERTEINTK